MPLFIVRVELHGLQNNHQDYLLLHTQMQNAGFSRTILYNNKRYYMPPAEYSMVTELATIAVFTAAKSTANKVTLNNAVMVTKSAEFLQEGLADLP